MNLEEATAYHEAGHALLAVYLGGRVRQLTIEPNWDDGPDRYADVQIEWQLDSFTRLEIEERSIQVALAGPVAEMIYRGERLHPGFVPEWAADWQAAWQSAATRRADEQQRLAHLEQTTAKLHEFMQQDPIWAALAALADNLLAHETLEWDEVDSILRQWLN